MAAKLIGGVIYPAIFHELQPRIGFGWATRVIAFIMLATLMIPHYGYANKSLSLNPETIL
jgi:hypothetical protein